VVVQLVHRVETLCFPALLPQVEVKALQALVATAVLAVAQGALLLVALEYQGKEIEAAMAHQRAQQQAVAEAQVPQAVMAMLVTMEDPAAQEQLLL